MKCVSVGQNRSVCKVVLPREGFWEEFTPCLFQLLEAASFPWPLPSSPKPAASSNPLSDSASSGTYSVTLLRTF